MYRLGVDMGGTKIEGIVLDPRGTECFRQRVPTEREKGYDAILAKLKGLYDAMVASIGGAPHTFGIGTPGSITPRTGLLKYSNTVCMNGRPVLDDLSKLLGRRIAIQNDANCFAMAEAIYGAGRGRDLVFGVILGTGCGGGIVYKGEVVNGLQSLGGEWGHMSVDPDGPACFCGRRGCVETFISGGGLERRYAAEHGVKRPLREIEADYHQGREPAAAFMRRFLKDFGRCVANLITILDPDVIVIGGGVSNMPFLYTDGAVEVAQALTGVDGLETPIVKHALGDSAGVIGAALIGV